MIISKKLVIKKINKVKKTEALKLTVQVASHLHFHLKRRPRIKLFTKVLIVLGFAFVISSYGASQLTKRQAEIKIAGKQVLVAQTKPTSQDGIDIEQSVEAVKSPFNYRLPIDGYISQGFSSYHRANDIAGPYNSKIYPIGDGIVEYAGRVFDGKGNMVIVDHGNGLKSSYSHMNIISVGVGNSVSGDSVLGTVGLTGNTTGPHVHLEVIDSNVMIDPSSLLPADAPVNLVR